LPPEFQRRARSGTVSDPSARPEPEADANPTCVVKYHEPYFLLKFIVGKPGKNELPRGKKQAI
jgi:hypothetical protein